MKHFYLINMNTNEYYEIEDEVIIGRRSACDISLNDDAVSGKHFKVTTFKNYHYITDLNSANSTIVNDEILAPLKKKQLTVNDTIKVGGQTLVYSATKRLSLDENKSKSIQVLNVYDPVSNSGINYINEKEDKLELAILAKKKSRLEGLLKSTHIEMEKNNTFKNQMNKKIDELLTSLNDNQLFQELSSLIAKFNEINKDITLISRKEPQLEEYISLQKKYFSKYFANDLNHIISESNLSLEQISKEIRKIERKSK